MRSKVLMMLIGLLLLPATVAAQDEMTMLEIVTEEISVMSQDQAYESYLAAPAEAGTYPAVVLIHSFNGLQEGYRTMTDQFAAEGFVVLAIGWQTFERSPSDALMEQLMLDSIDFLAARDDVDPERIGLTGFCAGGRYTMLFLPQIDGFGAGVAWYGFPNAGDPPPTAFVDALDAPMLIIHGTEDRPSPIGDIYDYANLLTEADKSFELVVYSDEPHGFMLQGGQLRVDEVAQDAFEEMVTYFRRKL